MTQNNPSYPVTFRTLLQISGCHTVIAARMLSAFSGFVMIHTLVVLKLTGHLRVEGMLALVLAIKPFMLQYRWLLFLVGLVIYSLPINLWAMVELFRFEFMQYKRGNKVYPNDDEFWKTLEDFYRGNRRKKAQNTSDFRKKTP